MSEKYDKVCETFTSIMGMGPLVGSYPTDKRETGNHDYAGLVKKPCGKGPIQPMDNVGEFGAATPIQSEHFSVQILECGCLEIKGDAMTFKLKPMFVEALRSFFNEESMGENNE